MCRFRMILPTAGAALLTVFLTGCTTPATSPTASVSMERLGEPISFSDDVSRSLARQTQHLLRLRNEDYLVGPDDVLEISIFEWEMGEATKTLNFRVAESGTVTLPAIGSVNVSGRNISQIQAAIVEALERRNILQNPRVGVSVTEFRSRRISVIGSVNAPGVYALHQNVSTLLDMLTLAGGPAASAGQVAHILRKQPEDDEPMRISIDLEELLNRGAFELNVVVQNGDVIFVPRAPMVFLYGNVRSPGGYALSRSMRAMEAIAMAGGFAGNAAKKRCYVTRRGDSPGTEVRIPLDFDAIEKGKNPNIYLREGDVLNVPESPSMVMLGELWDVFRGIFTFTYRLDDS